MTFSKEFDLGWIPNSTQWEVFADGAWITPIDVTLSGIDNINVSLDDEPVTVTFIRPTTTEAVMFDDATNLATTDEFPVSPA